jgi:hypothetical protein
VGWGLVEAGDFHWWLAVLIGWVLSIVSVFMWMTLKRIRVETNTVVINALPVSAAGRTQQGTILSVLRATATRWQRARDRHSGTGQHVCFFRCGVAWNTLATHGPATPPRATRSKFAFASLRSPTSTLPYDWTFATAVARNRPYDAIVWHHTDHISPWAATDALCRGAAARLRAGGKLVLYGRIWKMAPRTVKSRLRRITHARNPEWGLRDIAEVTRVAQVTASHDSVLCRLPLTTSSWWFAKTA